MTLTKRGFTMVELMVVLAMIIIIVGALSSSYSAAQDRARQERARSDVKIISQAILGYENFSSGHNSLPEVNDEVVSRNSQLSFLVGEGGSAELGGGKIPALLMAQFRAGGPMLDPWGKPYKVTIRSGTIEVDWASTMSSMQTGFFFPNFYRLSKDERR